MAFYCHSAVDFSLMACKILPLGGDTGQPFGCIAEPIAAIGRKA